MNIKSLDLNLLKIFDVLADELSVTVAARRLNVSQPAASGMLARLREYFDDPLFVRAQHGVIPTPRALELIPTVKMIVADTQTLLHESPFDPLQLDMTLCIAGTDYAHKAITIPYIVRLRTKAPRVRISMVPIDSDQLEIQAEKRAVDIALGTEDMAPQGMHGRNLFEEYYVCIFREGHPLQHLDNLTLEAFCQYDHALASYSGTAFEGITDDALDQKGLTRSVKVATKDFLLLPEMVKDTDMIAVVPYRLVHNIGKLILKKPPLTIPGFTKMALWHERVHYSTAHRWLRQELIELCLGFSNQTPDTSPTKE